MNVEREVPRAQRLQKIAGVKGFASGKRAGRFDLLAEDAFHRFHHKRCGDRVNVLPTSGGATLNTRLLPLAVAVFETEPVFISARAIV